jgi:hypothetical protein
MDWVLKGVDGQSLFGPPEVPGERCILTSSSHFGSLLYPDALMFSSGGHCSDSVNPGLGAYCRGTAQVG